MTGNAALTEEMTRLLDEHPREARENRFSASLCGEMAVMRLLHNGTKKKMTAGELSSRLSMTTSRVAAVLGSLEKKGLLERENDAVDRRCVLVSLTQAGEALCAQTGTKLSDIDLIGSHGQTFWHIPEKEEYLSHAFTSTFQLGEEAVLAERFGCPVVGNFRVRDVAAGGLGAPLVPYTEFLLYRSETEHTALQNIGGIGNITLLPAGCALSDVTAFDTGPGNMLIDAAIARITNGEKRYDANGAMAASGRVSAALLAQLMRDPYLSRRPPKTTGREHYGAAFVDGIFAAAKELSLPDADILATVTDFTAQTIAAAIRDFCAVRPARLIVGGGGSRNGTLMADIAAALPDVCVLTNEDLGFDGDAKEAVAFAVLANEAIFARCSNAPGATGARHGAVLGKITL